jgi:hypothetical protein
MMDMEYYARQGALTPFKIAARELRLGSQISHIIRAACAGGHTNILEYMLSITDMHRVPIDILSYASMYRQMHIIDMICKAHISWDDADLYHALDGAAESGQLDMIHIVSAHIKSCNWLGVLELASFHKHREIVDYLLETYFPQPWSISVTERLCWIGAMDLIQRAPEYNTECIKLLARSGHMEPLAYVLDRTTTLVFTDHERYLTMQCALISGNKEVIMRICTRLDYMNDITIMTFIHRCRNMDVVAFFTEHFRNDPNFDLPRYAGNASWSDNTDVLIYLYQVNPGLIQQHEHNFMGATVYGNIQTMRFLWPRVRSDLLTSGMWRDMIKDVCMRGRIEEITFILDVCDPALGPTEGIDYSSAVIMEFIARRIDITKMLRGAHVRDLVNAGIDVAQYAGASKLVDYEIDVVKKIRNATAHTIAACTPLLDVLSAISAHYMPIPQPGGD